MRFQINVGVYESNMSVYRFLFASITYMISVAEGVRCRMRATFQHLLIIFIFFSDSRLDTILNMHIWNIKFENCLYISCNTKKNISIIFPTVL